MSVAYILLHILTGHTFVSVTFEGLIRIKKKEGLLLQRLHMVAYNKNGFRCGLIFS